MKIPKYTNSFDFGFPIKSNACSGLIMTIILFLSASTFGSLSGKEPGMVINPVDQETLVDVLIISDGATWISIPAARMKPFRLKEKTVRLRPGEYTIVARKKGYEEVKIEVTIKEGVPHPPITVICDKEKS